MYLCSYCECFQFLLFFTYSLSLFFWSEDNPYHFMNFERILDSFLLDFCFWFLITHSLVHSGLWKKSITQAWSTTFYMDNTDTFEPFLNYLNHFTNMFWMFGAIWGSKRLKLKFSATRILRAAKMGLFIHFGTCASVITQAYEVKGSFHLHYKKHTPFPHFSCIHSDNFGFIWLHFKICPPPK